MCLTKNEKKMKSLMPGFFAVGACMVLAGAAVYITDWFLAPYIFSVGALLVAFAQVCMPARSQSLSVRRLRRQQLLGAFCLVLAGALMLFARENEWILSLSVGAVLELYTSFRIPQEEAKEEK